MKNIGTIILCAAAGTVSLSAQTITYPAEVKAVFESADASETADRKAAPVIAVPQCEDTQQLIERIRQAGGAPVVIPETADAALLRDMAAAWDGAALPDGWVRKDNLFSVLLYKAAADRNVPVTGRSPLTESIDQGLERYPHTLSGAEALVAKARTYHEAKALMDRIFCIDLHGDLPCCYEDGYALGRRANNQISLQKMEEGHLSGQVLVSFLRQKGLDEESSRKAFAYCDGLIDQIYADVAANSEVCGIVRTEAEARRLKTEGKKAFFIGIENGYGLGNDLKNVKHYADRGVIYITLSHTYDNAICHSSTHTANAALGLTPFGRQVVEEMNREGILVDVSHTSSGTFWDCIQYSKAPVICSHSGAKALFRHNRNITDDQLRALAAKGGVIHVYIVPDFMDTHLSRVSIDHFMEHLLHCIEVAGIDHVGIACDLDGGGGGIGLNGDNDLINITVQLLELGFSATDIEKIWSGNFFRVLNEVQALSKQLKSPSAT